MYCQAKPFDLKYLLEISLRIDNFTIQSHIYSLLTLNGHTAKLNI